jgi:hypothetical protein
MVVVLENSLAILSLSMSKAMLAATREFTSACRGIVSCHFCVACSFQDSIEHVTVDLVAVVMIVIVAVVVVMISSIVVIIIIVVLVVSVEFQEIFSLILEI